MTDNPVDARIEDQIRSVLEIHKHEQWNDDLRADLAKDIRVRLQRTGLCPVVSREQRNPDPMSLDPYSPQ